MSAIPAPIDGWIFLRNHDGVLVARFTGPGGGQDTEAMIEDGRLWVDPFCCEGACYAAPIPRAVIDALFTAGAR